MISSDNALLFSYALWLFGRVDYGVPLDRLREVIARWFFMAHTTSRYTGTFEIRFEQDAARFADLKSGDVDGFIKILSKIMDDTLTTDYWAITLPNDLATSASKSRALLAYIAALNILDADALLSTGKVRARLDPAITAKKGIERHHIFPRAYLRSRLNVTDNREINQIGNMAMVEWADNIAISDDAPNVYWRAQLSAKGLPSETLSRQMYWHALPRDWQHMNYQEFLPERRKLMAEVTRDAYAKLTDHRYIPVHPEPGRHHGHNQPVEHTHYGINVADLIAGTCSPQEPRCSRRSGISTPSPQYSLMARSIMVTKSTPPHPPQVEPPRADRPTAGHSGLLTLPTGDLPSRHYGNDLWHNNKREVKAQVRPGVPLVAAG
jgi:hypothetical protein